MPDAAERLRYAAFTFARSARWSAAATSGSWRRDALASAIISHAAEFILRTLSESASQLGLEPAFRAQLHQGCGVGRLTSFCSCSRWLGG